ncbi:transcription factor Tfb2 [Sistotremastrum niveocremeum HHB9708]|uniref:RNA polymerase II transcription factor B subunit 2 n=1 Tax=Sistotremastrum niveocremeum HHB9708 TaxID=1314777 RepID=A0A164T265_9AGAM|nr:transcription factor Tfb2 [Sistotremastrum niveocremeum HHB9708]
MPKDPETAGQQDAPHTLIPFLQSQSQTALTRLYTRPSSCLAIFRLLGPIERQIVMSLLWLEGPIASQTLNAWVTKEGRKPYGTALDTLSKIQILPNPGTRMLLNPNFKASFRMALTGGGDLNSFGVPYVSSKEKDAERDGAGDKKFGPNLEHLDSYALERWETILHYMVSSGTDSTPQRPSAGVLYLLQRSGLMQPLPSPSGYSTASSRKTSQLQISSLGFQFLLHTPHEQLWELLLQYLKMVEERQMDLVEVLNFLFMLSTMDLGREYSPDNLTQTQLVMLEDLRDYGLIWQRKSSSKRFSPTRLATTLTSSTPLLPSSGGGNTGPQGFIILETNYRLYAYTDNPLQIAVLNLFVHLKSRYPNLVVGSITRDSVRKALNNGIRADQIISYLVTHAHPQMRRNNPLLPVTVQDQIRLWELEKNRLKSADGYLYTNFAAQADYQVVLDYAKQIGVVLWENSVKRCFFASAEGHSNIRGFIERRSKDEQM